MVGGTTSQGRHLSAGSEQMHCASLILYTLVVALLSLQLFSFLCCLNKLYLSSQTSPPQFFPPSYWAGRVSCVVLSCQPG